MEKVILQPGAAAIIAQDAANAHPNEACGLLYGERRRECFRVFGVEPLENAERSNLERTFSIDPQVLLERHKAARAAGRMIIGHYHSHPSGPALPSQTDAHNITDPNALWLIHGRSAEGASVLNAFVPAPCGTVFKPLEVISSAQ